MKKITWTYFYFILFIFFQLWCGECFFFQRRETAATINTNQGVTSNKAVQEKIKNIVLQCMEEEKSNAVHILALFTINSNDKNAKCTLLCVMQHCKMMDKNGNYDKEKVETIMARTEGIHRSKRSLFGSNKVAENETLKDCIEKDLKDDPCDRAFVFTKCLQKQTKKSFHRLTGDLYTQMGEDNSTLEVKTEKLSTIEAMNDSISSFTIIPNDTSPLSSSMEKNNTTLVQSLSTDEYTFSSPLTENYTSPLFSSIMENNTTPTQSFWREGDTLSPLMENGTTPMSENNNSSSST